MNWLRNNIEIGNKSCHPFIIFFRNRTSSGGERDTLQTPTTPTKENKYMFDPCSAGANSNITGKQSMLDILYIII